MRIVVKFPTRGRPEQAARCLEAMRSRESRLHDVRYVAVCDSDDLASICAMRDLPGDVSVADRSTKIGACNAFTPPESEWDVLVMGSDDMWCVADCWDATIARDMEAAFPNLDGCLWYQDGNQGRLCTYPIMGSNWHYKCGSVYPDEYKSMWADNEFHEVAAVRGRLRHMVSVLFEHRHPAYVSGVQTDATYAENEVPYTDDMMTFERRRSRGFDWPQVELSILICHVKSRARSLAVLLAELNRQINVDRLMSRRVEVCVLSDAGVRNGGMPVGDKRQALLRTAVGKYVAFIDDDDMVSSRYVDSILSAIDLGYSQFVGGADAIGFGLSRVCPPSTELMRYEHSSTNPALVVCDTPGRPINHLNPVRRELAVGVGFKSKSYGEDAEYAIGLAPAIKNEVMIKGAPIYTYIDNAATSLTRGE